MKKCPHCGTELEEHVVEQGLCDKCGEKFDPTLPGEDEDLEETDLYDEFGD